MKKENIRNIIDCFKKERISSYLILLIVIPCFLFIFGLTGCSKVEVNPNAATGTGTGTGTVTSLPPSTISLTVQDPNFPNLNKGTACTLTAEALDSNGEPVAAGFQIDFSIFPNSVGMFLIPNSSSSVSVSTDSLGVATTLFLPMEVTSTPATITAQYAGSVSDYVQVSIFGDPNIVVDPNQYTGGGTIPTGEVEKITLSTGASEIVADGSTYVAITAEVTDTAGEPMPSGTTIVTFFTTAGDIDPYLVPTPGIQNRVDVTITNSNGIAKARLTSSTKTGEAIIYVMCGGVIADTMVRFIPGAPAKIEIEAFPDSLAPDETSSISATVFDDCNNPVNNIDLTFIANYGILPDHYSRTDADGVTKVAYTAPSLVVGTDTVTVFTPNLITDSTSITLSGASGDPNVVIVFRDPNIIILSAKPVQIEADGQSQSAISALVLDSDLYPVEDGTPVLFSIISGSGMIYPLAYTEGGFASTTLTSSITPTPIVTIRATSGIAPNAVSQTVNLTYTSGPPANIALVASTNSLQVGDASTATISATVQSSVGAPISGTIVEFSSDLGGISPIDTTDPNGGAEATFTAGTTAGIATITAKAGSISAYIVITINPGSASNIIMDPDLTTNPDPSQIYIKGTNKNQTSTFTFIVRDKNGNNVADGQIIKFVLLNNGLGGGETLKPGAGIDPNIADWAQTIGGKVGTTLESGYKAGTVKVIAFIDDNNNGAPEETEVQSVAIGIAINGGLPDGENFSVHPEVLNIAGLVTINLEDNMIAMLADRYHNNVPPGTAVYFTSDYASVTGQGIVPDQPGSSETSAILTSMKPLPSDGFVMISASTDTGNWGRVLCLAKHPTNPDIMYAGTDGGGIFKTTDAQSATIHWTWVGRSENGLTNGIVRDIRIDESQPSIIYAATDQGVFRSTGSGATWQNMSIFKEIRGESLGILNKADGDSDGLSDATYILDYACNQNRTKTKVYLNGVETRYYIFEGSQTIAFIIQNTGLSNGAAITIDYQTGNMLPTDNPVYALAIDSVTPEPDKNSIIYAALYGAGVYRSSDAGYSWDFRSSGVSNTNILSLAIDPVTTTTLYAGTWGGGIFRTLNSGDTWSSLNTGLTHTVVNTILVDPTAPTRIYAGTMLGGVFWYDNSGLGTWVQATTNVNATDVNNTYVKDIGIDTADGTLYAATYTDGNAPVGGVFRSADNGVTWGRVTSLENNGVFCLEVDGAAGDDTIYAGSYKRLASRTTNSGTTWSVVNSSSPDNLYHIFDTTQVLFSGHTRVTITPIYGGCQDYGTFYSIYNTETQTFVYTVSDENGNPLTAGSSITANITAGLLAGDISETIPDTQYGYTEYYLSWSNNLTSAPNIVATLTVSVSSANNGNGSASVTRVLIKPLVIDPDSAELLAGGGSVSFTAEGGSDDPANYSWSTTAGVIADLGSVATLTTTAAQDGSQIKVIVFDSACYQRASASVSQALDPNAP